MGTFLSRHRDYKEEGCEVADGSECRPPQVHRERTISETDARKLETIQNTDGVLEVWMHEQDVFYVKLANFRIVCLKGFNLLQLVSYIHEFEKDMKLLDTCDSSDRFPVVRRHASMNIENFCEREFFHKRPRRFSAPISRSNSEPSDIPKCQRQKENEKSTPINKTDSTVIDLKTGVKSAMMEGDSNNKPPQSTENVLRHRGEEINNWCEISDFYFEAMCVPNDGNTLETLDAFIPRVFQDCTSHRGSLSVEDRTNIKSRQKVSPKTVRESQTGANIASQANKSKAIHFSEDISNPLDRPFTDLAVCATKQRFIRRPGVRGDILIRGADTLGGLPPDSAMTLHKTNNQHGNIPRCKILPRNAISTPNFKSSYNMAWDEQMLRQNIGSRSIHNHSKKHFGVSQSANSSHRNSKNIFFVNLCTQTDQTVGMKKHMANATVLSQDCCTLEKENFQTQYQKPYTEAQVYMKDPHSITRRDNPSQSAKKSCLNRKSNPGLQGSLLTLEANKGIPEAKSPDSPEFKASVLRPLDVASRANQYCGKLACNIHMEGYKFVKTSSSDNSSASGAGYVSEASSLEILTKCSKALV